MKGMVKNILIIFFVVIIVGGGFYLWSRMNNRSITTPFNFSKKEAPKEEKIIYEEIYKNLDIKKEENENVKEDEEQSIEENKQLKKEINISEEILADSKSPYFESMGENTKIYDANNFTVRYPSDWQVEEVN